VKRKGSGWLFGLLLGLCLAVNGDARGAGEVDLLLVLAVDSSGSVDEEEYALQLSGIAAAFRDPRILDAIGQGFHGRIGVSLAVWAESSYPKESSPWHVVGDAESAESFARVVESFPRNVVGGTGIGRGILYCVGLILKSGLTGPRRVIDISGDGRETTFREWSVPPSQARVRAERFGVVINGLAILNEEPDLEDYYRSDVIVGPGAFTMAVESFSDFADAMRAKLVREILYRPDVSRPATFPPGLNFQTVNAAVPDPSTDPADRSAAAAW
jgi:hypothetical protein